MPNAELRSSWAGSADGGDDRIYDVAIVGFGPTGEAAANFAGRLGLRTIVVERDGDVFPRQRAIALDDEVMRTFQSLGLVERIRAHMHEGLVMSFVTRKGKEFLRLVPELSDDGHATVRMRRAGGKEERAVRARYVLGCDGGSSPIRTSLGFDLHGTSYPEQWLDVQGVLKRRVPGTPYFKFVCDPERPGVDCPCPGGMHRYEWRINQGEDAEAMQRPEVLWPLLKQFGGIDESYLEIRRTWEYTFHVRNCEMWRIDRVFLLGDAAHIMPPFAGQGMSAGVRDAANLLWKIALVLRGRADDRLLDSYQAERQKHVADMTRFSQALGRIVMTPSRPLAALRNALFLAARRIPGLRRYTLSLKGRPAPAIRDGFLCAARGRRTATGRLIPNVEVGAPAGRMLLDDALGDNIAVIGMDCDPRAALGPGVAEAWEALGARFVRARSSTLLVDEGEIGDPIGRLWEWFARHRACVAIVRPDRVVYGTDGDGVDLAPSYVRAPVGEPLAVAA